MEPAAYWIERLKLEAHPEGGFFRETFRSRERIDPDGLPARYSGPRNMGTCIYFLLTSDCFSAFHRLKSDEIWHFYAGASIDIHCITSRGKLHTLRVGPNWDQNEAFQVCIPAGDWFAAKVVHPGEYGLVGCTVSPGFDFEDFEMAKRKTLLDHFPQHQELILAFTRD